ncbi:hypothetical protein Tco_0897299 [Tanacetum coccineum]
MIPLVFLGGATVGGLATDGVAVRGLATGGVVVGGLGTGGVGMGGSATGGCEGKVFGGIGEVAYSEGPSNVSLEDNRDATCSKQISKLINEVCTV